MPVQQLTRTGIPLEDVEVADDMSFARVAVGDTEYEVMLSALTYGCWSVTVSQFRYLAKAVAECCELRKATPQDLSHRELLEHDKERGYGIFGQLVDDNIEKIKGRMELEFARNLINATRVKRRGESDGSPAFVRTGRAGTYSLTEAIKSDPGIASAKLSGAVMCLNDHLDDVLSQLREIEELMPYAGNKSATAEIAAAVKKTTEVRQKLAKIKTKLS